MTEAELIFTALAELSTRQIAESDQAKGMPKNKVAARKGGGIREEGAAGTGRAYRAFCSFGQQLSATGKNEVAGQSG
jgi:hypothetical protein